MGEASPYFVYPSTVTYKYKYRNNKLDMPRKPDNATPPPAEPEKPKIGHGLIENIG